MKLEIKLFKLYRKGNKVMDEDRLKHSLSVARKMVEIAKSNIVYYFLFKKYWIFKFIIL